MMANNTTIEAQNKPTEGVAVLGSQFRRSGGELVTGQAAEAARKQLAELAEARTKGYGGTYGFYAIKEEARVVDAGWQASMEALRAGWAELLEGPDDLINLLPADTIKSGQTEMRGRFFTGCWEVTALEPLTAEQRAELLETGGYAAVCPGVDAADKGWRWAVPASFVEKGITM